MVFMLHLHADARRRYEGEFSNPGYARCFCNGPRNGSRPIAVDAFVQQKPKKSRDTVSLG